MKTMSERRDYILTRLDKKGALKINELKTQLGVSTMTVHRDLNKLAAAGLLRKERGEILRPGASTVQPEPADACALCGGTLSAHDMVLVSSGSGERKHACCAHCGLMLLLRSLPGVTALTVDFITHRMVNARQAVYVVESSVTLCCSPGILTFASAETADQFCQAFGGRTIGFQQALTYVQDAHGIA